MVVFTTILRYNNEHMKNDNSTVTIPRDEYIKLQSELADLRGLVGFFQEQFRLNRYRQYGASSEKSAYDAEQLSMHDAFNEAEANADICVPEPELIEIEKHFRKRTRLTTDKLPKDLPIETVKHALTESERICPECGGALHVMGSETSRVLVIIPAQVKIREDKYETYSCRECEKKGTNVPIIKTPVDEPVIKGGFASPESVAQIMTQKFVMGTPLYRQEQELNRNGINLSRQTMSNWIIKATEDWLEPIYDELHKRLLTGDVIHADETTLQVLREPGKKAQSKSYMWTYLTGGNAKIPIVLYEYQPDRKAIRPAEFLKGFIGYLHCDGYDGYHKLPEDIIIVGCLAHLRRKFDEALKTLPEGEREKSNAWRGKRYCDKLFELERTFAELPAEERYIKRLEQSKPVMDEFFSWVQSLHAAPKTSLGLAVHYALSQRKYLENYLLDGRCEISNNRAERSIKPFVIGRKNFLFANTPRGAKASAIVYSIIETAKENGINPFEYLVYIFKNAPNWDIRNNPDNLNRLLPDSFIHNN
jgi:transposase